MGVRLDYSNAPPLEGKEAGLKRKERQKGDGVPAGGGARTVAVAAVLEEVVVVVVVVSSGLSRAHLHPLLSPLLHRLRWREKEGSIIGASPPPAREHGDLVLAVADAKGFGHMEVAAEEEKWAELGEEKEGAEEEEEEAGDGWGAQVVGLDPDEALEKG